MPMTLLSNKWVGWAEDELEQWVLLSELSGIDEENVTYNGKRIAMQELAMGVFVSEGALDLLREKAKEQFGFSVEDIVATID